MPHPEHTSSRHERPPPPRSLVRIRALQDPSTPQPIEPALEWSAEEPDEEHSAPFVTVLGDGTLSAAIAAAALRREGYRVSRHCDIDDFLEAVCSGTPLPDLIVIDSGYSPERVAEWLATLRLHWTTLPLLLIAGDTAMLNAEASRANVFRTLEPPALPALVVAAAAAALGVSASPAAFAQAL